MVVYILEYIYILGLYVQYGVGGPIPCSVDLLDYGNMENKRTHNGRDSACAGRSRVSIKGTETEPSWCRLQT